MQRIDFPSCLGLTWLTSQCKWLMPVRLKRFYHEYRNRSFILLDVGCGKNSYSQTKKYFPYCQYHGIDQEALPGNSEAVFYQINLDKNVLPIPDEFCDCLIASHLLEHLNEPMLVLKTLCSKVKRGGKMYLEFPSLLSMSLPSMEGTMQFCDDPTHIQLPNPYDVINVLLSSGMTIRCADIRRDGFRFLVSFLFVIRNIFRRIIGKRPHSRGLWDLKGFSYYVFAEKR
jgi:hypothetical protein